jgi:hypothetical protein
VVQGIAARVIASSRLTVAAAHSPCCEEPRAVWCAVGEDGMPYGSGLSMRGERPVVVRSFPCRRPTGAGL